jgi:hypothetical protein
MSAMLGESAARRQVASDESRALEKEVRQQGGQKGIGMIVVLGVSPLGEEEGASVAVRRKVSVLKMHIAGQDAPSPSGRAYGVGLTQGESSMAQVPMVVEVHNNRILAAQKRSMEKATSPHLPSSD